MVKTCDAVLIACGMKLTACGTKLTACGICVKTCGRVGNSTRVSGIPRLGIPNRNLGIFVVFAVSVRWSWATQIRQKRKICLGTKLVKNNTARKTDFRNYIITFGSIL